MSLPASQVGPFADSDSLPQWAIALIVMGSCITLAIVMVLIAKAMHYYNLVMSPGAIELVRSASRVGYPLLHDRANSPVCCASNRPPQMLATLVLLKR